MALEQDYSYALDENQRTIYVEKATKDKKYFCPCCGFVMIPKQGKIRKWHFAHTRESGNCSYETYLHKLAKKRIRECFEESYKFIIQFYAKSTCNVTDCPLGVSRPCSWDSMQKFDLKKYYNKCEEEKTIGDFRADLLLTNNAKGYSPILIEIQVSHESTEKKLNSGHRIIEIKIESEEDIDSITSTSTICESERTTNYCYDKPFERIRFYNFNADKWERPDTKYQAPKFIFWINAKNFFYFNFHHVDHMLWHDESVRCLTSNSSEIENSKFRIEAKEPFNWDFAFYKLSQSRLGLKYCTMCNFYRMNDYCGRMCILYKSRGTAQYPKLSFAQQCPHFKQINYEHLDFDHNQECKIIVNQQSAENTLPLIP